MDVAYLATLARGAEQDVAAIESWSADTVAGLPHRETMRAIKAIVAVFSAPESERRHNAELLTRADSLLAHLEELQRADGLFDSENLQSPPDTCFTITDLCITVELARAYPHPLLEQLTTRLAAVALRAVDALVTGGVHTPNHRWELTAALARLNTLWPDARLIARAEEWLAEGIDAYPDGHYSERSANYAAHVTNPSLLAIAEHLDRPEYLELVRRNLAAILLLLEDDLTVETVHSRRQDQNETWDGRAFLSQFRHFAVLDSDSALASAVRTILDRGVVAPTEHLAEALIDPVLQRELPHGHSVPSDGHHVFPSSGLARIRSGAATASIFGGSDLPRFRRIASGLANSSTVVRMRHGAAVVEAIRLSPSFFGLGAFRGESLDEIAPGHYQLRQTWSANYYQPLAAAQRRASGDYELDSDGRFFAAMSFSERPTSPVSLTTTVGVRVDDSAGLGMHLDLAFDGADTSWALEIVLRPGGVFDPGAALRALDGGAFELVEGEARYRVGNDVITLGPGNGTGPRQPAAFDPGELVDYVGGTDVVPGIRVYITGRTSVPYSLQIHAGAAE